MKLDYTRLSKNISRALRHAPWIYELELDEEGWTDIENLLEGLRSEKSVWKNLSIEDLHKMIFLGDKKRFQIENNKIRALYGHSLPGKINKTPATPPEILYHGTAPKIVEQILREGLKPMNRQYVHLSADKATALSVGKRKAQLPVILKILALQGSQNGVNFYQGNDLIWLADTVPSQFIIYNE
ncbi:MAG TPA: RNA 2'-phosphotransferase [Allocoleopsis sp.]